MNDISGRILNILTTKQISYDELSRRTGIHKSTLQRYATGTISKIPCDRLELIARAIGVSSSFIMAGDEKPAEPLDAAMEPQIFIPRELKTIEVDTEKKIFRVNGEDFGKGCSYFMISCDAADGYKVRLEVDTKLVFTSREGMHRAL